MAKFMVSPKQCTWSPHPSWDLLPYQVRVFSQCLLKVMGPHCTTSLLWGKDWKRFSQVLRLQALLGVSWRPGVERQKARGLLDTELWVFWSKMRVTCLFPFPSGHQCSVGGSVGQQKAQRCLISRDSHGKGFVSGPKC